MLKLIAFIGFGILVSLNGHAQNGCKEGMLLTIKTPVASAAGRFVEAGKKVQLIKVTSQPWGRYADVAVLDAAVENQECKLVTNKTTLVGMTQDTFVECAL